MITTIFMASYEPLPTQESAGINTARDLQLEERRGDVIARLVAIVSTVLFCLSNMLLIMTALAFCSGAFERCSHIFSTVHILMR
jgi:hypothetical protein